MCIRDSATARDLKGGHENIIAVIGDGSRSGGEAYEGLSNAGEMGTNLIIVVNECLLYTSCITAGVISSGEPGPMPATINWAFFIFYYIIIPFRNLI